MSIEYYVNQYGDLILDAHWSIWSYAMHMQLCNFMCEGPNLILGTRESGGWGALQNMMATRGASALRWWVNPVHRFAYFLYTYFQDILWISLISTLFFVYSQDVLLLFFIVYYFLYILKIYYNITRLLCRYAATLNLINSYLILHHEMDKDLVLT